MAPQTIIDYIVVHELCHLHYRDHIEAFWNEVDKVIPNYRERKEWLRKHGVELDLWEDLGGRKAGPFQVLKGHGVVEDGPFMAVCKNNIWGE